MCKKMMLMIVLSVIFMLGVSAAYAGTIAQFNYDSLTGAVATDISGNGHDVTFHTAPTLTSNDPFSQASNNSIVPFTDYYPDGYLANPGTINLNNGGSNKFTLEGWIKPTSNSYNAMWNLQGTGNVFLVDMLDSGYARACFNDWGAWYVVTSSSALTLNQWSHLAMVYDAGNLYLYVNGVSQGVAYPYAGVVTSLTTAVITTTGGNPGTGASFDDLRLSNVALTPAQLGYNGSFTVPEPATMAILLSGAVLGFRKRK